MRGVLRQTGAPLLLQRGVLVLTAAWRRVLDPRGHNSSGAACGALAAPWQRAGAVCRGFGQLHFFAQYCGVLMRCLSPGRAEGRAPWPCFAVLRLQSGNYLPIPLVCP